MIFGMAFQHGLQGIETSMTAWWNFGFGWVFGFDEVENLSGVVGRRVLLGGSITVLIGLPPNFVRCTGCQKQDAQNCGCGD